MWVDMHFMTKRHTHNKTTGPEHMTMNMPEHFLSAKDADRNSTHHRKFAGVAQCSPCLAFDRLDGQMYEPPLNGS